MLPPPKTDIAVAILFFNRPDMLAQTFEAVRQAQPSHLLLYQDGSRGANDDAAVEACRRIVADENIDWQCDVRRNYQTRNYGCDPSEYLCQKWAFSLFEDCVFVEDDDVISPTFLPFCREMLDRYRNDERIGIVCGFNVDEKTSDIDQASYFFSSHCSIWGWASWRRVFKTWEADYAFLQRPESMAMLEAQVRHRGLRGELLTIARSHAESGKEYYESILAMALLMHSRLNIFPRVNMVKNIGTVEESVHFSGLRLLPHEYRRIFTMGIHDLDFPLTHPHDMIDHTAYRERVYDVYAWRRPWKKVCRSLEELWLNVKAGQWGNIATSIKKRAIKLAGRKQYR